MSSARKFSTIILSLGLLLCSFTAFASIPATNFSAYLNQLPFVQELNSLTKKLSATNPITYSVTPSTGLPSTTYVNSSYAVNYTITNNLPFPTTLGTTGKRIDGIGFSLTDQCSGQTLAANGTCNIDVSYHPQDTGIHSIQLLIPYDKNRLQLPSLTTTTENNSTEEVSGNVTEPLPAATTVGTGYNVEFSFTNKSKATSITDAAIVLTGDQSHLTSVVDGCTGTTLAPSNSCTVSGTYTPNASGSTSVGATYQYDSNTKSVALSTHTTASSGPTSCASVDGTTPLMLPTSTYIYGDNVVKFQFKNNCDAASATLGNVDLNATLNSSSQLAQASHKFTSQNVSSWITKGVDNCSGATLSPEQTCSVDASIVPTATGNDLNVAADLSYTESSQTKNAEAATTSNSVLANTISSRTITVINQCSFPVWMSFVAAAAPGAPTPNCKNGAVCPLGTQCASNQLCYYSNPQVANDGELLGAQANKPPHTMDITVPENNAGSSPLDNVIYNASIVARRGCSGTGSSLYCTENNCGGTVTPASGSTDSQGLCTPGVGVNTTPGISYNGVEFTFLKDYNSGATTDGVYDEQTINGVNVPLEIKGRGPATAGSAPYNDCPPAGAIIQKSAASSATQLGNCNYDYITPSTTPSGSASRASDYRFITPPATGPLTYCEDDDNACTAPQVCGLAYHDFPAPTGYKLTKICGTLQGYVSVNTGICSQSSTLFHTGTMSGLQTLFNCATKYPSSSNNLFTGAELFACSGTYAGQSCYNPNTALPSDSCCGCVNWWERGLDVPTDTSTCTKNGVTYSNPYWTSPAGIVQPQIQWMKEACPTAYSYQYDDPSSSFHCTVANNNNIVTNYQVTFCPGGKSL